MSLKNELKELNLDNPEIKDYDFDRLIESMLNDIGSTDPELRDQLIYSTFAKLILKDYLNPTQMEHILDVCLDPLHLYFKLGEKETDSVFTRSFSALVVALILAKDRQSPFLKSERSHRAIEASLDYLNGEADLRGYVKGKGWAHGIAHGADLLDEAINHPHFSMDDSDKCLDTIKLCLFKENIEDVPYVDDEWERLIFSIEALLNNGIEEDRLVSWAQDLVDELTELGNKEGKDLRYFRIRSILTTFLKSLYFRLMYKHHHEKLCENIFDLLKKVHHQIYP